MKLGGILKKILLLFFLFLVVVFLPNTQSDDSFGDMKMNATLNPRFFYHIELSNKLSEGIFFTNQTGRDDNIQYKLISGTNDNEAIWNYNGTDHTEYYISVTAYDLTVDLCQGATNHLCTNPNCTGLDNNIIFINNTKWSSSHLNNVNDPSLADSNIFTLDFDNTNRVGVDLGLRDRVYMRYWLDVPPNTPAYDFNTTYQIMGVSHGDNCA